MADRFSPIAVVGLGALFPGSAEPGGFWRDIVSGRDLLTDVPPDRWLIEDYYDPDPSKPDKTYAKRGAFLSPIEFDPLEHGVPPTVVPSTDTSQLLGLIVAKQVLEDATKHRFDKLDRDRVSVVLGITSAQELLVEAASRLQRPVWVKALREEGVPEDEVTKICDRIAGSYTPWQEMTFPGLLGNVVAGRIANRLNLGGTNCVTDAACASALSALTMGVSELRLGDSDMVIVGGVETFNDIFMYMCFSKTPAMSPTGDCRPFSSKADGTMLGEGIGFLALRRLEDAERDGDAIYAVIRGIGSSSDGRAKSIYAPVAAGQAKALRRAYDAAGYGPDTVDMVEAHATGTKAGDAAEFEGLRTVFDESGRADRQWCSVGSIKSQIGHTKAAAGAAGMLKAVLALQHKTLPPTAKIDAPNPQLEIEKSPFYLNVEARPWVRDARHPRRASVSAFGFGGSNFHVALEEYTGPASRALRYRNFPTELVVLSATTPEELRAAIAKLRGEAETAGWPRLARLSQESFDAARPARLAIVAGSLDDLLAKLADADKRLATAPRDAFAAPGGASYTFGAEPGKVAFLFPGQGSQSLNMGRDLALGFESALTVWDRAAALPFGNTPLHEVVFPKAVFDDASKDALAKRLTATEWAQPAIGGASLALLRLVASLGLRPDAVAGHSFGELVALHAAGALSEADLLRVARQRGELMAGAAAATPGAMLAVAHAADEVRAILESERLEVVIANHNSPKQVVLAGSVDAIAAAEKVLKARGLTAKKLPVATAFHSSIVAPSSEPFRAFLAGIDVAAPTLPVFANETAAPYAASADAVRDGLARQIANPVRFAQIVEALYGLGVRTFVEVGPGAVLTGLVGECLAGLPHVAANLDRKGQHGVTALWNGLARLAVAGVPLAFAKLWEGYRTPAPEPKKPGLRLTLTGATYQKPYPPKGGSAALPKPNPPRPPQTVIAAAPTPTAAASAAPSTHLSGGTAVASGHDSGWLAAWQEMQRQTAEAHAAYQRTMADTHGAFLRASETSFQALAGLAGGAMPALPVAAPAPAFTAPVAAPVASAPAPLAAKSAPVAPAAAAVVAPAPIPVPAAAPAGDLTPALLEVVSEKTGYPAEMLQLEMELEADLGVDSIKRVEILAALTERVPGLPSIGAGEMGALRTLGQIAQRLQADAPAVARVAPIAAPTAHAPAAAPAADLTPALLAVVSEKTGYPAEMLQLEMELEADLGVDSIKRVEILAALTERVPGLPSIGAGEMGALRTLGQIAQRLQADAPAPARVAAAAVATAPAVASAAPSTDVTPALLAVVAEKTGYPAEMLQLEMELEADLGVDSIKRVEILAALTERVPGLPSIGAGEMGALRTLGQIAQRLAGSAIGVLHVAAAPAPPAAAPAPAVAPAADLTPALLAVVAEKTGYPAEMLQLEMELEADLGVDSIKRVEILAALTERVPGLPQIAAGEMAQLRTLRQIAARLAQADAGAAAEPAAAHVETKPAAELGHFALELRPTAPVGLPAGGLFTAGPIAITDDGNGVAAALAERLARLGADVRVVAEVSGEEAGAIVLSGLRKVGSDADVDAACREAFEAARKLAAKLADKGGLFVTVQDTGGDLGLAGRVPARAALGALAGLAKTAAQEWPLATVRAIDVAAGEPTAVADALAAELLNGGFTREVALGADGIRREPFSVTSAPADAPLPCDETSVVVATGGARGVTADCLLALAHKTHARFALLGRTPLVDEPAAARGVEGERALNQALLAAARAEGRALTPADLRSAVNTILSGREVRHTLDALKAAGSEAVYVATDARDAAAVAAALDGVRQRFGPITGLVHGAGVLADRLLRDKTSEQFERVWGTKVLGLRALLAATGGDPLRFVALFSSVAGRCGNAGQSDYAMANEALNKTAAALAAQRPGCRVIAMGWGPWDGGMVTPALRERFEARGVPLVTRDRGPEMFLAELAQHPASGAEVVLGGEPRPEPLASESAAHEARFDLAVNSRTEPLLADHTVAGAPVVPAAFALDWFARAALALRSDLRLAAVRDLKVVRGIRVTDFEGRGTRLTLSVREVSNGTGARLALELRGEGSVLHYTAAAEMAAEGLAGPQAARSGSARSGEPAASLYGETLFHGPAFHVLRHLDAVSAKGAAASCAGVPEQGWAGRFALDVAAVDGALQLAIVWGLQQAGAHTLPTGLGAFVPRGAFPARGPLRLELIARQATALRTVSDVLAFDAEGAPVFELRDVEMHAVPAPDRKAPALQGAAS
ncbi:MAG: SDR family NAD(P)-dependent oxidoreductase [Vicinamibacteria bacterium]|nr:SDR family NAD(P)-dependent oxidoreductase [Vicinamibacteria bacterium]